MLTPIEMEIMYIIVEQSITKDKIIQRVGEEKYNYYHPLYLITKNKAFNNMIYNCVKNIRLKKFHMEYTCFIKEMSDKNMFSSKENITNVIEIGHNRLKDGNYYKEINNINHEDECDSDDSDDYYLYDAITGEIEFV